MQWQQTLVAALPHLDAVDIENCLCQCLRYQSLGTYKSLTIRSLKYAAACNLTARSIASCFCPLPIFYLYFQWLTNFLWASVRNGNEFVLYLCRSFVRDSSSFPYFKTAYFLSACLTHLESFILRLYYSHFQQEIIRQSHESLKKFFVKKNVT